MPVSSTGATPSELYYTSGRVGGRSASAAALCLDDHRCAIVPLVSLRTLRKPGADPSARSQMMQDDQARHPRRRRRDGLRRRRRRGGGRRQDGIYRAPCRGEPEKVGTGGPGASCRVRRSLRRYDWRCVGYVSLRNERKGGSIPSSRGQIFGGVPWFSPASACVPPARKTSQVANPSHIYIYTPWN